MRLCRVDADDDGLVHRRRDHDPAALLALPARVLRLREPDDRLALRRPLALRLRALPALGARHALALRLRLRRSGGGRRCSLGSRCSLGRGLFFGSLGGRCLLSGGFLLGGRLLCCSLGRGLLVRGRFLRSLGGRSLGLGGGLFGFGTSLLRHRLGGRLVGGLLLGGSLLGRSLFRRGLLGGSLLGGGRGLGLRLLDRSRLDLLLCLLGLLSRSSHLPSLQRVLPFRLDRQDPGDVMLRERQARRRVERSGRHLEAEIEEVLPTLGEPLHELLVRQVPQLSSPQRDQPLSSRTWSSPAASCPRGAWRPWRAARARRPARTSRGPA